MLLSLQSVCIGYKGRIPLLSDLNAEVEEGELIALAGENGKGKTTLLKTLCGIIPPEKGNISIRGKELQSFSAQELASEISVVLTEKPSIGNISVANLIAFGRYPFTNWLGIQREEDRRKVEEALEWCQIGELKEKGFSELSDGERQKVMIARAIAQGAKIMILDEPTAHLDISNRLMIVRLLARLAKEKKVTVIYSTHEIELALRNSERVWLIHEGKVHDETPASLLNGDLLNRAFAVPPDYFDHLKKEITSA